MWEFLQDPIFEPDGSLKTEYRDEDIVWMKDGKKLDKPIVIPRVRPCEQVWQRVSVVDLTGIEHHGKDDYHLLIVPVGEKSAIWWPDRAIWRKVGDVPEIDWKDVVADGVRLGDGERVVDEVADE